MRISDWSSDVALPISFGIETGFLELGANGRDIRRIERHAFAGELLLQLVIQRIHVVTLFHAGLVDMLGHDCLDIFWQAIPGCFRSEERRVGKECDSPCRYRWLPYH